MDILGTLGGILGDVATGGIFGLIGSIIGVGAKWLQERQRMAWEREKWGHEVALQKLEIERGKSETENELRIVTQQADSDQRLASYGMQIYSPSKTSGWVNNIRALFRPALTLALLVLTGLVFWKLSWLRVEGYINEVSASGLTEYIIHSIVFAASTAVIWWFGDRAMTPSPAKAR
tara:strand:- start:48 stop:575 length:528 start_codon:yes stop_codon:yes gene_type:complete